MKVEKTFFITPCFFIKKNHNTKCMIIKSTITATQPTFVPSSLTYLYIYCECFLDDGDEVNMDGWTSRVLGPPHSSSSATWSGESNFKLGTRKNFIMNLFYFILYYLSSLLSHNFSHIIEKYWSKTNLIYERNTKFLKNSMAILKQINFNA